MPKLKHPYQCDFCDRVKGETNHWFLRLKDEENLTVYFREEGDRSSMKNLFGFRVFTWDDTLARQEKALYICSESCLMKSLQAWLSGIV